MSEQKPSILHVEDDMDFQGYISVILGNEVDLTQAGSLKEGKRSLGEVSYDLILLDLTLPDGSGMELVNEMQRRGVCTPVFIFSAHEVTDSMLGASEVFVKGHFVQEDLVNAVRAVVNDRVSTA